MRLDRDTTAHLHFLLPQQHPELFAALHRAVQEHLDGLKAAGHIPEDIDLYRALLDFDVRPAQEIAERKRDAATFHLQLRQLLEVTPPESSIEF
jgi:hypothetical protein